jgi:Na+/phosphate symporter
VARRTTGDTLVLMVAGTVCTVIVLSAIAVVVVVLARPDADVSHLTGALASVDTTLVGIIAGYLAGRTGREKRED